MKLANDNQRYVVFGSLVVIATSMFLTYTLLDGFANDTAKQMIKFVRNNPGAEVCYDLNWLKWSGRYCIHRDNDVKELKQVMCSPLARPND